MSNIIGADAAKLAGLQIDTLQKVRNGQITFDQWERFNNLSSDDREARFGDWKKTRAEQLTEKFALLADLGTITVPVDYVHATWLASFLEKNRKKFYGVNSNITDANFPNPTRILKPGDKLRVRAFKQVVGGTTTSEERMAFLKSQNAVFVGAQGTSLVFEQKRDQLPKGKWYCSFDEKMCLWEDADGGRRVPYVSVRSDGGFFFSLGYFEDVWSDDSALL
ncbi:MAG: hypothetical protein NTX55_00410, partial [Candidatus Parcubacteria bacterium]|nr:hypothetical protein [Candidatus Parcubacteria bacterium]